MADTGGTDWFSWLESLFGSIFEWGSSSSGDPNLLCTLAAIKKFPAGSPELNAAFVECRAQFPRGTSGNVTTDIKKDISDFLNSILGNVTGDLGGLIDVLKGKLRDAIGGLGTAGVSTVGNIGDIAGAILGTLGSTSTGVIGDLGKIGGGILGELGGHAGGILDVLGFSAGGVLESVGNTASEITGNIGAYIDDFLKKIREAIVKATDAMANAVSSALTGAINTITRTVDSLVHSIQSVVEGAVQSLTNLFNKVVDSMSQFINDAIENITVVADRVFNAVADTVENIKNSLVEAFNNITQFIGDQIHAAGEFIQQATSTLTDIGHAIVSEAEELAGTIQEGLHNAITELVDTASGALSLVSTGLDNLQNAVTSALEGIGPILSQYVATPLTEASRNVVAFVTEGISAEMDKLITTPTEELEEALSAMGLPKSGVEKITAITDKLFDKNPLLRNIFMIALGLLVTLAFAQQIAQAAGIKALQEMQPSFPVALPAPGDLADMVHYGAISEEEAALKIMANGYDRGDADRYRVIRQKTPDIGVIQVWYLRKFIDRAKATEMLGRLGLEAADAGRILDMAFFIPPVSDLITMSVREVFTPEVAEKFGQFEQYPDKFTGFAAQQGISEEWAKNYWAAHWALPSVTMGFEMLHRRVINAEELDLLLRAQDVMPFWREKLTKISYSPLTRVDIRRMHKLGVLSDADLINRYMDLGYDKDNATFLQTFTIELNKGKEGATPAVLEDLTRGAIASLYRKHTLTRQQAKELMEAIGIGSDAAELFLSVVDLETEAQKRTQQTNLIIDRAKAGVITFSEARGELATLGLEALEVEQALTDLQQAQDANTKIPSKNELDDLLKYKLIDKAVYLLSMIRLGYSAIWAERFMELVAKKP